MVAQVVLIHGYGRQEQCIGRLYKRKKKTLGFEGLSAVWHWVEIPGVVGED